MIQEFNQNLDFTLFCFNFFRFRVPKILRKLIKKNLGIRNFNVFLALILLHSMSHLEGSTEKYLIFPPWIFSSLLFLSHSSGTTVDPQSWSSITWGRKSCWTGFPNWQTFDRYLKTVERRNLLLLWMNLLSIPCWILLRCLTMNEFSQNTEQAISHITTSSFLLGGVL